uniref:TBC1 domain family member 16-like n=1 Tax=Styela clava TaxID=7725 RepID=UPI00193A9906|nr:TBC1 domain family member 16-like [Styela clava]XP_039261329.1 TBC1 domain family member 16-like [Styela clava]
MSLTKFIKTIFQPSPTHHHPPPLDGEIVYSKNNVCVHPQGLLASSVEHYPGYLTVFAKVSGDAISLVLNWIPNKRLKHGGNPVRDAAVIPIHCESLTCINDINPELLITADSGNNINHIGNHVNEDGHNIASIETNFSLSNPQPHGNVRKYSNGSADLSDVSICSGSTEGPDSNLSDDEIDDIDPDDIVLLTRPPLINLSSTELHEIQNKKVSKFMYENIQIFNVDKKEDIEKQINAKDELPLPKDEDHPISPPVIYNMQFPENSISYVTNSSSSSCPSSPLPYSKGRVRRPARDQACGVFTVDLGQMRSLRLFFSNDKCNSGQLVIASRESQYKILHFHNGGLDALAEILEQWKLAVKQSDKITDQLAVRHFSICGPQLSVGQCHPEEGLYRRLSKDAWSLHVNEFGQVQDEYNIRKAVFFGGMDPELRSDVWLFLLKCYPFLSTYDERQEMRSRKEVEYHQLNTKRLNMSEDDKNTFEKGVACIVEKDVLRTDRAHPFYKGDGNPNLDVLRHILLNYSIYTDTGYTQGMSDLLAPLLIELNEEAETFWCFVGLMQRTIFISSPKDDDMEKQLLYLRELLRLMQPEFYEHLKTCGPDAMELLFVHRWILLCFKREFPENEALMIWESCWAHYQTDFFHLFVCVAIITLYGLDVIENQLASDEMLLHFSNLAMQMNGHVVLRKARGLLHSFRIRPRVPCTLHDICIKSPPGVWDSGYAPTVECTGLHDSEQCLYGGVAASSSVLTDVFQKSDTKKLKGLFNR